MQRSEELCEAQRRNIRHFRQCPPNCRRWKLAGGRAAADYRRRPPRIYGGASIWRQFWGMPTVLSILPSRPAAATGRCGNVLGGVLGHSKQGGAAHVFICAGSPRTGGEGQGLPFHAASIRRRVPALEPVIDETRRIARFRPCGAHPSRTALTGLAYTSGASKNIAATLIVDDTLVQCHRESGQAPTARCIIAPVARNQVEHGNALREFLWRAARSCHRPGGQGAGAGAFRGPVMRLISLSITQGSVPRSYTPLTGDPR